MTTIGTLIEIPITGTSTGAATTNIAVFDFATAGVGSTNLDNSVVSLRANFIVANSAFTAALLGRRDAVVKRISGSITIASQTPTFGAGPVTIYSGDSPVQSNIPQLDYIVVGTQIILRVVTSGSAGTFLYGGRMIGLSDK